MVMDCEHCMNFAYDEELQEYYCGVDLDEDDMVRFYGSTYKTCPFFKNGDEYQIVKKQM